MNLHSNSAKKPEIKHPRRRRGSKKEVKKLLISSVSRFLKIDSRSLNRTYVELRLPIIPLSDSVTLRNVTMHASASSLSDLITEVKGYFL